MLVALRWCVSHCLSLDHVIDNESCAGRDGIVGILR